MIKGLVVPASVMKLPCEPPPAERLRGLDPRAMAVMAINSSLVTSPAPEIEGYTCERLLGEGALGVVWRARREADGQPVAIKVPRFGEPMAEARLREEAASLASLDHPHIVALYEVVETDDGRPALVMELAEGGSLKDWLPPEGLPQEEALRLFRKIASGVEAAHQRHVLHRDLKPGNVLLTAAGEPKVADFGLALPLEVRRQAFSLTLSGQFTGTVEYVAPESYHAGAQPSVKTDIYALGVILYEMLTGSPPRGAWKPAAELRRVDVRLDELINEAVEPDPAKRLGSVRHMLQRLDEIENSQPRYDSRALVTKGLRWGDFFWSVLGACLALFCASSFLSLIQADVVLPLGFFNAYAKVIEALLATHLAWLWLAGLMLWLVWRERRLRYAPPEDRLPLPFGWRPSSRRLLSVLRAVSLLLFIGWPLFFCVDYGWWLWGQHEEGVLVLQTTDNKPLSWWRIDPADPLPSNRFAAQWKIVSGERLWIEDSTAYWPGLAPVLMVACLGVNLTGLATLGLVAFSWMRAAPGRWKWGVMIPCGMAGLAGVWHVWPEPLDQGLVTGTPVSQELVPELKEFFSAYYEAKMQDDLKALADFYENGALPAAAEVPLVDQVEAEAEEMEMRWPVVEHRYGRQPYTVRTANLFSLPGGVVRAVLPVEYHATHRSRSGQGGLAYVVYHLRKKGDDWKIFQRFVGNDVLYQTDGPPPLDESSLSAFADAWCEALGQDQPHRRVADFYWRGLLLLEEEDSALIRDRVVVQYVFRRLAAEWPQRRFSRTGPVTYRLLPGLRVEVSFPFIFEGTAITGQTRAELATLTWHLVYLQGRWRILVTPKNCLGVSFIQ